MTDETTAKLADLKAKHGTIWVAEVGERGEDGATEDGVVAYRRPTRLEFRAFKANRADDEKAKIAEELLCKSAVVYPDAVAFDALLDKLPALAQVLAQQIVAAGGGVPLEAKKF